MIKYDGTIDIAVGSSVRSRLWENKKYKWSKFIEKISKEHRTIETYKEYISSSKDIQGKIKDVGGYIGAYLKHGIRKPDNVMHRQLITLDIDFAPINFWEIFIAKFKNASAIHSTHKHSSENPRYRLIIPLNRKVTPEEYIIISKKIASLLGTQYFDNTTYDVNRLMFWPSCSKDSEYYFKFQDLEWVDPNYILDLNIKEEDFTEKNKFLYQDINKNLKAKQENPLDKKGIVGYFCRAYSITEAIDTFLNDVYSKVSTNRYSYINGSTSSGLIIYEDKFAYSHHGTDPISEKLCNAFDLVRIHKFRYLDYSDGRDIKKSFSAMEKLALKDKKVKKIIAKDKLEKSRIDFSEEEKESTEWMVDLEVDSRGKYLSNSNNINLIFKKDFRLSGIFKRNIFDSKSYVCSDTPWRKIKDLEPLRNVDYSGLRNYIESIYGISSTLKIEDSFTLEIEKNAFHPIVDYLNSCKWDGISRIDSLLIDYFGAENNVYSREAIRKMLVGAVSRVLNPGCKFDFVLTLVGSQGTGKSTFIKKLGKFWFSDTFLTVQGKEALEQIQGSWIIEMAELSGIRKADIEAIKHFISKQEDTYRPAYGRTAETYLRQCVFFGTTNNFSFLRDPTGNRRFLPVDVHKERATKNVFTDLTDLEIDKIWAEALMLYKKGEPLYLSAEAEDRAIKEQKEHSEEDERKGLIERFLDFPLPKNWDKKDIYERRAFLEGDELNQKGGENRKYVCVAEIWCECLGKNKEDMDRYKTREINDILKSLEGWEFKKSTRNFKLYGKQKYYEKK